VVLDHAPLDERMVSALDISFKELAVIDRIIDDSEVDGVETFLVPPQSDMVMMSSRAQWPVYRQSTNIKRCMTGCQSEPMMEVHDEHRLNRCCSRVRYGYTWNCRSHTIFDVKMDLTRKARWVLDGHKQDDPVGSTYAGVISRESVRIAFTYAALNGLDVWTADIRNAYLQAPSSQKNYIICGPELDLENVGKVALIRRAIYGGKSAGKDFRNHLRSCMAFLELTSCPVDPYVWMRKAIKGDGSTHWEYVLLYTDDALVVSENPESILWNELGKYFQLKEESIGPPYITWR
jgi:hypothetical protein